VRHAALILNVAKPIQPALWVCDVGGERQVVERQQRPIGSMRVLTVNPHTGRQQSSLQEFYRNETIHDVSSRASETSRRYQTTEENNGKRIVVVDGEETEYAHFEIIKKQAMLVEFDRWSVARELAASGIIASREEIFAMRALGKDDVYVLERGSKTFVVSGNEDGKIQLFSAKVYIPVKRNCAEFGGQDAFLNTDNTPAVPEFDGAILRIRAVYTRADFPNSTFEPLRGVYYGFDLHELKAGEACPADVANEIFRGMNQMRQTSLEADAVSQVLWVKSLQVAQRQNRTLLFDVVRAGFSSHFEETRMKKNADIFGLEKKGECSDESQVMPLESQLWFGTAVEERVAQESVPALLAQMPIIAESLAVVEFPAKAQEFAMMNVPRVQKIAAQAEVPAMAQAAGNITPEKSFEAKIYDSMMEKCGSTPRKYEERYGFSSSKTHATDERNDGDSRGRRMKRKTYAKPIPLSALTSFKAVIFDLDGVIVDSEMVHPRTFERALAKYGVKIKDAHWKRAYTGIGSYAIFDDIVKKYGIMEDARELVKKRNEIYLHEIQENKLPVIGGFREVHRLLAGNGVKEAVASGGHTNHVEESLRSVGLRNMPFVAIEQVKRGKPSPEIFLKAARRLRVKSSECIVFEDSLSGVEAAARACMPCVALSTTMPARKLRGKAALIVNNFRSRRLKKVLAVLLARKE